MNSILALANRYYRLTLLVAFAALIAFVATRNHGSADSSTDKTTASHRSFADIGSAANSQPQRPGSFFKAPTQSQSRFTPSALTLTVNDVSDGHDGNPGDGICDTGVGFITGACTLRAAIEEYE